MTACRDRLGVYVDTVVDVRREDGRSIVLANADSLAFLRFVRAVGDRFSALVLFARQAADAGADFPLDGDLEVAAVPHYARLSVRTSLSAAFGTGRAMWRHLDAVDHVWVFGPHPLGLVLLVIARVRGKKVTLGVRQDTLAYFAARMSARQRRAPLMVALRLLNASWMVLSRRIPTTVAGSFLERRYAGPRRGLLAMAVSLVPREHVASSYRARPWGAPIRLLTVGRMEPEKTPLVLVDAVGILERRTPGRYHLTWVGAGAMRPLVKARVAAVGIADRVSLRGFVPGGDELFALYRDADIFVHVAATEAFGQVLVEAQALGVPVVGTDVGGVSGVLDDGRAGLLVRAHDPSALADAIERLDRDADLRRRLVERGLSLARRQTLETTSEIAARFLARLPVASP
jgi:glycosyltransferase involved in cell wall biosynthesis